MKYYLFYLVALVCLSQASIIIKWSETNPLTLGSWRLLLAGLILFSWSRFKHSSEKLNSVDKKKITAAGFSFFIHLLSYASAARMTSISHLMLIYSVNPLTTALGSWIFFKERITLKQGFSYILALIGIYILSREKQGNAQFLGDLLAVAAAFSFSAYALLSRWARRDLPNSVYASRMYLVGSAFFFVTALSSGLSLTPGSPQAWGGVLLLTLLPTLLGHGVFTFSMTHIPLPILSVGKLLEPAIAAISAFLLFGERLTAPLVTAFILIAMAVILVVSEKKTK